MFRNYLKIAVRSLLKHKLYSGINVFGLALGMACALLIGLWVRDELSYDRFLTDAQNVYFVRVNTSFNGQVGTNFMTPGPLQETIAKDVPEVAAVTKIDYGSDYLIKVGDRSAKEHGHYATNDFFRVFDLPALYGTPSTALAQPNQIVITQNVAEKYFPNARAVGKTLQLNNDKFYVVGAVIENLPTASTLQFDWLIGWQAIQQDWMEKWGNNAFFTYVRLKPNVTPAQVEASMKPFYGRYANKGAGDGEPILQPITDVHLYGDYKNGKPVGGRIEYVRIFSVVALFILLIACINFMNLATARSAVRAREVGVRKVVGALRSSLIGQFMSESALTSLLAVVLSLGLVWAMLPTFNALFDKHLSLDIEEPTLWFIIVGLVLLTGFVSGSYPALFLSALQPVRVLKGRLQAGKGPVLFRRTLVVFQFTLSIFLIAGMLVVGHHMDYLRTRNLGLDRGNVITIPLEGNLLGDKKTETFRQEVMRQPSIAMVTTSSNLPVDVRNSSGDLEWPGKVPDSESQVAVLEVGGDFVKTMNVKLLAGRDFRTGSLADSASYIVNEAALKLMGMDRAGSPIGKQIKFWRGSGPIVGLLKDFHIRSLYEPIYPLLLMYNPIENRYLLAKTRPGQTQQALADLEKLTKQFNPNYPFTYHFLDEEYEKLYRSEQQVHTLVNYFGVLAILISCLGLFALAAFTAEQRTKEIGVRKVLGASVVNIVGLLSTDFLKLVLVALLLATPLAWWALDKWLSTFAYHDALPWWVFALAGLLAVLIALATVSYQSIRAALVNPVKSLRSE